VTSRTSSVSGIVTPATVVDDLVSMGPALYS
jgi:hypothetical protein